MSTAECPYCLADVEICHDDGYGYDESRMHHQDCPKCEKTFAFRTMISFDYDTEQAPCLNGGEHTFMRVRRYGSSGPFEIDICTACEHEQRASQSADVKAGG